MFIFLNIFIGRFRCIAWVDKDSLWEGRSNRGGHCTPHQVCSKAIASLTYHDKITESNH